MFTLQCVTLDMYIVGKFTNLIGFIFNDGEFKQILGPMFLRYRFTNIFFLWLLVKIRNLPKLKYPSMIEFSIKMELNSE
uniref:Uncharacterized protein n=1 Tax=Romanomermis culicivorax TaxID=13658 RepID=A0A915JUZ3_ROMCU